VRFSGAAAVTVLGSGFLSTHIVCMIDGDEAVQTVWISRTKAVCFCPELLPGMHSVSLGHNSFQQSAVVVFEVLASTKVLRTIPSDIVVRSFMGSSAITLVGSGFMRNMVFMANEIDCPSEFLSSESVKLFVPYDVLDGKCDVYAVTNGNRLSLFQFVLTTLEIDAVVPAVMAAGVMQVVTISGQFSQFEGLVFCMESGSNSSTPVNDDCSVPTLVSYNRVEISINIASGYYCMFAAIRKDTTVFGRSLSLCGIRGATSTILSIGPTQGMANQATTITIRGQSFFPAMSYECLIGRQILSPAVFLNSPT